jgi:DNA-directed RNA polymerase specialized sigma24 family protein
MRLSGGSATAVCQARKGGVQVSEQDYIDRLVSQVRAGDRESFRELFMSYFDRIQVYMELMLGNEATADAATDETFRRVYSGISDYRPQDCSLDAWICRLMRREAQRRVEWSGEPMSENPSPASSGADTEAIGASGPGLTSVTDHDILRRIARLHSSERELVVLHYIFGLKMTELAAVLDREVDDVRAQHQDVLDRLNAMVSRAPRKSSSKSGNVIS